ncbi:hypothetical protein TKK_0007556 [Trichogramma kaykai]|uniref:Uncharacterized protein n=1 Tax=Trichogramma kaykai TaxID=54128 RepID=A0ABD2WHA2_9HYME
MLVKFSISVGLLLVVLLVLTVSSRETRSRVRRAQNEPIENPYELDTTREKDPRWYWNLNNDKPEKDVNYLEFGPFLQKYIAQEQEIKPISGTGSGHPCTGGCSRHELSRTDRTPRQGGCGYRLRNCQTFDQDINVCKAELGSAHKYEYVKTSDGNVYGKLENCHRDLVNWYKTTNWFLYYNQCELCLCTCDEHSNNRSIDLQMVRAAAINNEVIVGLRFRMKLGLLFMEARTAKLLPSGHIDAESKIWKRKKFQSSDISKRVEGVDFLPLSWSNRSFVLDDVELGNDYVLTGVRFVYENGFIKLAARGHKFDFKNGTIDTTQEIWVVSGKSKPESEYSEFSVENRDVPTDYDDNKVDSYNGGVKKENIVQFVKLTTSSMESDVGQSVVPFVDIVPVVPEQLTPLSGVGLIHKGTKKSAGYLALKVIGYDFEPRVGKSSI